MGLILLVSLEAVISCKTVGCNVANPGGVFNNSVTLKHKIARKETERRVVRSERIRIRRVDRSP